MARVESVQMVDDLDGGAADETVSFSLDGRHWQIDLTSAHAARLRDDLAPYVAAARRSSGGSAPARDTAEPAATGASASSRRRTAEIRQWALANGFGLSERGRIPNSVVEAYEARDGGAVPDAHPASERSAEPAPARAANGPVDVSGMFKEASAV